ncbi:MAG: nuclease-related domain-containing protein, partial [Candidatus Binatia bacterium]
ENCRAQPHGISTARSLLDLSAMHPEAEQNGWLRTRIADLSRSLVRRAATLVAVAIGVSLYDAWAAIAVLAVGVWMLRIPVVVRRLRWATNGAAAEEEVARALARLPDPFVVVNDVEFDGFNVDHVVVGPSGVWAIETKSKQGRVEPHKAGVHAGGCPMFRDPRRQARGGARALANAITRETGVRYWIEAVVCMPYADVQWADVPAETLVLGLQQLMVRLRRGPARLQPHESVRITRALGRIATRAPRWRARARLRLGSTERPWSRARWQARLRGAQR